MKYAAASDKVIYEKKKKTSGNKARRGDTCLTAIQRKIKASIENVNDAASQVDMRRTRK
jgi:hypothetical protein